MDTIQARAQLGYGQAYQTLELLEGLRSDDPEDPGGDTVMGLAHNEHPEIEPWPPTPEFVKDFMKREFWDLLHLDDVAYPAAERLFLAAVNMGPGEAVKCMQRALRRCGFSLEVDGDFGPLTRAALSSAVAANRSNMLARLRSEFVTFYIAHDSNKFLPGLLWRACW